jgi:hypothetical protein
MRFSELYNIIRSTIVNYVRCIDLFEKDPEPVGNLPDEHLTATFEQSGAVYVDE